MGPLRTIAAAFATGLSTLGLSHAMPQPIAAEGTMIQMLVVEQGGVQILRGVTVEIARNQEGLRYFYSQAVTRKGSWATV